ncbi:hypothetical protein TM102_63470 [Bradyrhizobium sp. TM102]|nr:hypothetical protein TM102_63470 [Bradyrhizobium sp. TM102]
MNRAGHLDHQAADTDDAAIDIDAVDVADLFGKRLHKGAFIKDRALVIPRVALCDPRDFTVKTLSFAIFLNGA